jgi:hypothetical protein
MPNDPRNEPAFLAAYSKLTWDSSDKMLGQLKPRAALAQQAANFYDPKLVDWLLKEMKKAPDFNTKLLQLDTMFKIMTSDRKSDVADAVAKVKKEAPADIFAYSQQEFDLASGALDKCKSDVSCYESLLDQPIPNTPPTAYFKAVKAAWMTVIFGGGAAANATRTELVKHVDKVKNPGARIAVVAAIDELAPQGDTAAADALDKIVAADEKGGDKDVKSADNTVAQVAWRLRARAQ